MAIKSPGSDTREEMKNRVRDNQGQWVELKIPFQTETVIEKPWDEMYVARRRID